MMGLGIAFLVVLALAAGGSSGKKSGGTPPLAPPDLPPVTPGGPDPKLPSTTTVGKSGTTWVTQVVPPSGLTIAGEPHLMFSGDAQLMFSGEPHLMFGTTVEPPRLVGGPTFIDVFLPAGQMGSPTTFRVLRFSTNLKEATSGRRFLTETVPGVDPKIVNLAISDFSLFDASQVTPGKVEEMLPLELREKLAAMLRDLTVDPTTGKIVGPVTAEIIQRATALAAELERAGFPEAAATLRAFAQAAASLVASPPKDRQLPLPGLPADMAERVNRAITMERDPAKLRAIVAALRLLPQSPERDQAVSTIEALIVSIEAKKASDDAKAKISEVVNPPTPQPVAGRTYTVQSTDKNGAWALANAWTGRGQSAFLELARANPKQGASWLDPAKKGAPWFAGMVIAIPASWPAQPVSAAVVPTPSGPAIVPVSITPAPSASAASRNVYIISATDGIGPKGPGTLALSRTGNFNRWKELIPLNPQKKLRPDGMNFLFWNVGETINLPDSWSSGAPVPTTVAVPAPAQPILVSTTAQPQPLPEPKTAVEIAAESMVRNLRSVQSSRGARGAMGKEDQNLVRKFQTLAGGTADGKTGPGTLIAAARAGQSNLPAVMYWPMSTSPSVALLRQSLIGYRSALQTLANEARAAGLDSRAIELEQSIARELAQGDSRGPITV